MKLNSEQRKKGYRAFKATYDQRAFKTAGIEGSWVEDRFDDDPAYGAEVLICLMILRLVGYKYPDDEDPVRKFYEKYWYKWEQRYLTTCKEKGGYIKHMNPTEALKEFLARGFVYKTEFELNPIKYHVKTLIGGLVWPDNFELHQDALDIANRFGIPGHTTTTIPKS